MISMSIAEKRKSIRIMQFANSITKNYLKIKSTKYGWLVNDKFILPFFIDKHLIFKRMLFTYQAKKI